MKSLPIALALLLAVGCKMKGQNAPSASTQHFDLPAGGTVRLPNAAGLVTVEGWDQPGVDLTLIKSIFRKDDSDAVLIEAKSAAKIEAKQNGKDLVLLTTGAKKHRFSNQTANIRLEYRLKIPREAALAITQSKGQINVDGVTGDIQATAKHGEILLRLPESASYTIDAEAKLGSVISDFPGAARSKHWLGKTLVQTSPGGHRLFLRQGFGDILILKARAPHE